MLEKIKKLFGIKSKKHYGSPDALPRFFHFKIDDIDIPIHMNVYGGIKSLDSEVGEYRRICITTEDHHKLNLLQDKVDNLSTLLGDCDDSDIEKGLDLQKQLDIAHAEWQKHFYDKMGFSKFKDVMCMEYDVEDTRYIEPGQTNQEYAYVFFHDQKGDKE